MWEEVEPGFAWSVPAVRVLIYLCGCCDVLMIGMGVGCDPCPSQVGTVKLCLSDTLLMVSLLEQHSFHAASSFDIAVLPEGDINDASSEEHLGGSKHCSVFF
jgi:hypothetical protein